MGENRSLQNEDLLVASCLSVRNYAVFRFRGNEQRTTKREVK